jgi:carbon-monoxide dehydrogenase medium subunit
MHAFQWVEPKTITEALDCLDTLNENIRMISGGTALMQMMKSGVFQPTQLISLRSITGNDDISLRDQNLCIGAMASLSKIEKSDLVRTQCPTLINVMKRLANVRVRNSARIGGALAHGDPHMDLPPFLSCLDATVQIQSKDSKRIMPLQNLYLGYYETSLAKDELITEILIPIKSNHHSTYLKCTTRSVDDWPALGIAADIRLNQSVIEKIRLVVGAACEIPTTLSKTESFLTGKFVNDSLLNEAVNIARSEIIPLSDELGSSEYKLHLTGIYLKRAIKMIMAKGAEQ